MFYFIKMNIYKKIESKDPGVTVSFKTPLGNDISRTGTLGDGSCFFHSLLYGIDPEYKNASSDKKYKIVKDLRKRLSQSLDIYEWEKLGNGNLAIISYSEIYSELVTFFYNVVSDPEKFLKTNETNFINKKLLEILFMGKFIGDYEKLFTLITVDDFEKFILPKSFENGIINSDSIILSKSKDILKQRIKDKLEQGSKFSEENIKNLANTLYEMISTISKTSKNLAYNNFSKNLESCNYWVDHYLIEYISNYVDRDIYIIDDTTRMPYNLGNCDMYKGRKSVIILWIGRGHYESIGKIIDSEVKGKKEIIREFNPEDPLIQRINVILCNPKKVITDYPEFIQYLPKEEKELLNK